MKKLIAALVMLFAASPALAEDFDLIKEFPEVRCMALNIYYEARGSSLADRAGVADVVLNRVNDSRYPDTICEVVKQGLQDANGNMRRNKCQFSWYCDGRADTPQNEDLWVDAQTLAWNVVENGKYRGLTEGATHYHADYVDPSWAESKTKTVTIGKHIFYRWEKK